MIDDWIGVHGDDCRQRMVRFNFSPVCPTTLASGRSGCALVQVDYPRGTKRMKIETGLNLRRELTLVREQFGFRRSVCGCNFCTAPCRHMPGSLDVSEDRKSTR